MKKYYLILVLVYAAFLSFAEPGNWGKISNGLKGRVKECTVKLNPKDRKVFYLILNIEIENTYDQNQDVFIRNYNSHGRLFKAFSQGKDTTKIEEKMKKIPLLEVHLWAELFWTKKIETERESLFGGGAIGDVRTFLTIAGIFGSYYNDNMDISRIIIPSGKKGNIKISFTLYTDSDGCLLKKKIPIYAKFKSSIFPEKEHRKNIPKTIWEGELVTGKFYIPEKYFSLEKDNKINKNFAYNQNCPRGKPKGIYPPPRTSALPPFTKQICKHAVSNGELNPSVIKKNNDSSLKNFATNKRNWKNTSAKGIYFTQATLRNSVDYLTALFNVKTALSDVKIDLSERLSERDDHIVDLHLDTNKEYTLESFLLMIIEVIEKKHGIKIKIKEVSNNHIVLDLDSPSSSADDVATNNKETEPKNAGAYYKRGNTKSSLYKHKEAIKDYNKAIKLAPANASFYQSRGWAKRSLEQYKEAIKDYDMAIKFAPRQTFCYSERGYCKYKLGQYEEAIKDYNKAIKLNPKNIWDHMMRGDCKKQLKQYEAARADLLKTKKLMQEQNAPCVKFIEEVLKRLDEAEKKAKK